MRTCFAFVAVAWIVASIIAATPAAGSLSGNSIGPTMYTDWGLEQRPLVGNVTAVESGREVLDERTGAKTERVFGTTRFVQRPDGIRVETAWPQQTKLYDTKGRLLRAEGECFDGGTRKSFKYVASIEYDAAGSVQAFEVKRDGQTVSKLTGKTEPLPGGGRGTRLVGTSEDRTVVYLWDFDADGGMTRCQIDASVTITITRNDRGDVASYKFREERSPTEYEYRYDDQGNWIRRETFRTQNGARKSTEVEFRRITYGPQSVVVPATAPAMKPGNLKQDVFVGAYESRFGNPTDDVYMYTRFELKADGKLHYVQKSKLRDQVFEKEAEGRWMIESGKIVLRLEKTLKGPDISASLPQFLFTPAPDGKSLTGSDGKLSLKRAE